MHREQMTESPLIGLEQASHRRRRVGFIIELNIFSLLTLLVLDFSFLHNYLLFMVSLLL